MISCVAIWSVLFPAELRGNVSEFDNFEREEINPAASGAPGAGLEVADLNGKLYLIGGRTPLNPHPVLYLPHDAHEQLPLAIRILFDRNCLERPQVQHE